MTRFKKAPHQEGFSLVELLVVIAIVALMTVAGAPAISALINSGNTNENLTQLGGILEQARQYAVAQNTYVWVAFYSPATATGSSQVSVAAVASKDGTDLEADTTGQWPQTTYTTSAAVANLSLVSKIVTLKQVSLKDAGSFSSVVLPTLPAGDTAGSLATNSSGYFSFNLPGTNTPVNFTQAIEFTPTGQALNASSPASAIDLDVQPQKGDVNDKNNIAVLRINGLTGETVLYRQ